MFTTPLIHIFIYADNQPLLFALSALEIQITVPKYDVEVSFTVWFVVNEKLIGTVSSSLWSVAA